MLSIAKLLLEIDNEFNGHKGTVIKGLSLKHARRICKELEEYTNDGSSFVVELWTDNNWSILQKDKWQPGEHPLGHTDQLILSNA